MAWLDTQKSLDLDHNGIVDRKDAELAFDKVQDLYICYAEAVYHNFSITPHVQ